MRWSRTAAADDVEVRGVAWTQGSALAARAVSVVLLTVLLVGSACGVFALLLALRPRTAAASSSGGVSAAQWAAQEVAQRAVVVWLEAKRGDEQLVAAYFAAESAPVLPEEPAAASDPTVAAAAEVTPGLWAVTVAVTVADARQIARRYFMLPVQVQAAGVTVLKWPHEVAATGLLSGAVALEDGYHKDVTGSAAVNRAVSEFLTAYLAGSGDVTRYVSPGSGIGPVVPAPYVSVSVVSIWADRDVPGSDGQELQVLVSAIGRVSDKQQQQLCYPLVLRLRAGRWEVGSMPSVPLTGGVPSSSASVVVPQPSSSPVPTGSPSGGR